MLSRPPRTAPSPFELESGPRRPRAARSGRWVRRGSQLIILGLEAPENEGELWSGEAETTPPTVRRGSRGPTVSDLQKRLKAQGFDPGPLDGIFGTKTDAAVRAFQRAKKLTVDGIVGPKTWGALLGGKTPSTPVPPATTDWTGVSAEQRMRYVMRLLVEEHGYPVNAAAGIVGNLWAESGVIPNRLEGSNAATPMRTRDFDGRMTDFTAEQVMNRSTSRRVGPRLPGVGLAQWTSANRRRGLFEHVFNGTRLGADILFDMDAQVDYLVNELSTSFARVNRVLTNPAVTVDAASDEVVYNFERPGSVIENGRLLPRTDPRVQEVFRRRREHAQRALRAYTAEQR